MLFVIQNVVISLIGISLLLSSLITDKGRPYTTFFSFIFLSVASLSSSQVTNGQATAGSTTLVQLYGLLAVVPLIKFIVEIWYNFFPGAKKENPGEYARSSVEDYERNNRKNTLNRTLEDSRSKSKSKSNFDVGRRNY